MWIGIGRKSRENQFSRERGVWEDREMEQRRKPSG
jgi:hypothetical protein